MANISDATDYFIQLVSNWPVECRPDTDVKEDLSMDLENANEGMEIFGLHYFSIISSPFSGLHSLKSFSWKKGRALSSPDTMELTIEAHRHK